MKSCQECESNESVCINCMLDNKKFCKGCNKTGTYFSKFETKCEYCMKKIRKNFTDLERLILKYPRRDWNFHELSANKSVTWDFIQDHPEFHWKPTFVSVNPNVSWEIVKQNQNYPWNYYWLSQNDNITIDIVKSNPGKSWNTNRLALNKNITWEIIKENPNMDWNYRTFSGNPNLTWKIVKENPDIKWDYNMMSENDDVIQGIIDEKLFNLFVIYPRLQKSKILTEKFLKFIPGKEWCYEFLYLNENFMNSEIFNTFSVRVRRYYITALENPKLTWKDVRKRRIKGWKYSSFAKNPNITYDIVTGNYDIFRDSFYHLSSNTFEQPEIKARAIKTIQNAIIKWIYQPRIYEYKLGINVRLGLKKLYNLDKTPMYLHEVK